MLGPVHYRGARKKQWEAVLSIADAIHQFHSMVVNIVIDQNRKAVMCLLLHLLTSVYNRDKVWAANSVK